MVQRRLVRRWHGVFDRVVAISDSVADRLRDDGLGVTDVLPNGVSARPPHSPLLDPPTVAFAGRLSHEKGADVLVRAFASAGVPGSRLVIAGDGPERPRLERLAGELGLDGRVSFLGRLSHVELERELGSAWVEAMPSRWREPFGNTAAEALARGTALVASSNAGVSAFAEHGRSALLVPPGDVDALASALRRLLGDGEAAQSLGRAGRDAAARRLSRTDFLDRLETIYGELAGT
jgi:glycosyltransferase involved in cell wall biosynthesis